MDALSAMIRFFDDEKVACQDHIAIFGNKARGLAWLTQRGVSVPFGFVIPMGMDLRASSFKEDLKQAIHTLEQRTGKQFGNAHNPLLVSVRSGAAVSMPGMMDSLLNVGLCADTVQAVGHRLGCLTKAQDLLNHFRRNHDMAGKTPWESLCHAIYMVASSGMNARATAYRKERGYNHNTQTAIIVQEMVFGNGMAPSGTGVLFTRHPSTGKKDIFGEYLDAHQGESLVSGAVTPQPLVQMKHHHPDLYADIVSSAQKIESWAQDMQDIEFTYEKGTMWILQTRAGKRTARAAFVIAHTMVQEGLCTKEKALKTIDPLLGEKMLCAQLLNAKDLEPMGQGLPASTGSASGPLVFDPDSVTASSILVRPWTACEDMPAMIQSAGVVTLQGGVTSHAAVVMRGIGKPCITSLKKAHFANDALHVGDKVYYAGDSVTLDGTTGWLYKGQGHIAKATLDHGEKEVLSWAKEIKKMTVLANADTPEDIRKALSYGAEGVGLCRSEHMMFQPTHMSCLQQFLLSPDQEGRRQALTDLKTLHQKDIEDLFHAVSGKKLTVRLIDPPLHEFLPTHVTPFMATQWGISVQDIEQCIASLKETNPMMGHRGCRLSLSHPELYDMQIQALFQAAVSVQRKGIDPQLSILIPFVAHAKELDVLVQKIRAAAPPGISWKVGTMIETPRSCLIAKELAPLVDFFSFGTNDLTQMTWGISRDDSAWLMASYDKGGIADPFRHFDCPGVGFLIQKTCQEARAVHPKIQLSVCGEHASQPHAIAFFNKIGVHSVSCAPSRMLSTLLASAQCVETQH
jgi:pyruvate,orthophosphate dikinase